MTSKTASKVVPRLLTHPVEEFEIFFFERKYYPNKKEGVLPAQAPFCTIWLAGQAQAPFCTVSPVLGQTHAPFFTISPVLRHSEKTKII